MGMTINEWAKDFKAFVDELQMPRDDYKGIMEYIDEGCALLKEQEAVKPNRSGGMRPGWWCGACNYEIGQGDKYCKHCGQAVKWK